MPLTLRLDPWTPTYESALQIDEDETGPQPDVDPFVETDDWRAREPQFVERPRTIAFVDGVQRVEMRVIGDRDGKTVYGAFASVAVGAVFTREGGSEVAAETPLRILALADGETHPAVSIPCGEATLEFKSRPTAASGLSGVQEAVQSARREAEIALGERLDEQGHEMVVVDGRLNWQPKRKAMVIGLIKTIHKRYLDDEQAAVIATLAPRTRTPLFRIGRDRAVYSWYLRLTEGRAIDHAWAGVIRVETLETIGIEAAVKLADLTAYHLPTFASDSMHDPRAPQNLYPIGGLEDQLRHSLGDPEWIRRHIEMHFAREVAQVSG
ncbi:MAG: hypothetical protein IIC86_04810 [Chloroflexi bacterium]|nr:hypothetical protein [Chloroflexota bacterium]